MWQIGGKNIKSRMFLGTSGYSSLNVLKEAITLSHSEVITTSLTRTKPQQNSGNDFYEFLKDLDCHILPNTAGCYTAREAINTAKLARELFQTSWIKLEVIADDYTLQPNVLELIKAAEELNNDGFIVFPYCTDDIVICKELVNLGCNILMPMASPIGSGQGVINPYNLYLLRDRFTDISLIVDAGLGKPSHAVEVMEMGYDGILLNTAISNALDPAQMAKAFSLAVESGKIAYNSGLMPKRDFAKQSTPYFNRPFQDLEG